MDRREGKKRIRKMGKRDEKGEGAGRRREGERRGRGESMRLTLEAKKVVIKMMMLSFTSHRLQSPSKVSSHSLLFCAIFFLFL